MVRDQQNRALKAGDIGVEGRLQFGPPQGSYPLKANLIGHMDLPKICPTCQAAKSPTLDPSPLSHFSPVLQLLFSLIREGFRRHHTERAE